MPQLRIPSIAIELAEKVLATLSYAIHWGWCCRPQPVAGAGLLDVRWLQIAVREFELFFGLWLLSGSLPHWTPRSMRTELSATDNLPSSAGRLKRFALALLYRVRPIRSIFGKKAVCLLVCLVCPLSQGFSHAKSVEGKVVDRVIIKPKIVNFGRVNNTNGPLDLSFTITNHGDQPIEITGTRSGCGCTVVKLSKSVLPPGDHLVVSVTVSILGRLGKFENRVLLDVAGQAEPVSVPIQGTVVQDLWFNDRMIQCFATDSAPTIEKTFEVHTVDWPLVQFDWTALDKSMSIRELSRSKHADETVIKFHLRMKAPKIQSTTTWHVNLVPLDKRIKPLTIPVVCRQPSLRSTESSLGDNEAAHLLRPDRISLGVVLRGEEHRFQVSGPSELVHSLKLAGLDNVPEGTKVKLHPINGPEKDLLGITIRIAESAPGGLLDGRIRLASPDGHKFSIAVLGIMGPRRIEERSNEITHGQEPSTKPEARPASR